MKTQRPFLTLSLATAAGFLFVASGCVDEQSRAAQQTTEAVAAAARDYRNAGSAESAQRLSELQSVAGSAQAAGGPAGALLEAGARLDIARQKLTEADALESEARSLRNVALGLAGATMELGALAEVNAAFNISEARATLDRAGRESGTVVEQLTAAIAQINGPVDRLTRENQQAATRVAELRTRSRQLREDAFDAGDLLGHSMIVEAVSIDREADQIEAAMAQRDIELSGLQSQLRILETQLAQAQHSTTMAQQAGGEIDGMKREFTEDSTRVRSAAGELSGELDRVMGRLRDSMARLETLYGEATTELDNAAARAATAGGGESAGAMRASALETKGRMNTMQAAGLNEHAALLTVIGAGGAGDIKSRADSAAAAATAAYREAIEALGAGSGHARETAMLSSLINQSMTGEPVDYSQFAPDAQESGGMGGASPVSDGRPGASSPEELVQIVNQAADGQDFNIAMRAMSLVDTSRMRGTEREAFDIMLGFGRSMQRLDSAIQSRFARGLQDVPGFRDGMASGGGMNQSVAVRNARVQNVDGDSGTVVGQGRQGQATLTIHRTNGRWFIDGSSLVESAGGITGGAGGQAEEMAMQMIRGMFGEMSRVVNEIADRVERGEFSTFDELVTTIEREGAGATGGMPGSGGRALPR